MAKRILEHLMPAARRKLLSHLLLNAERRSYVRQLVRDCSLLPRAVSVELARLRSAGLVIRESEGNRVYYRANPASPLYGPLKALFAADDGRSSSPPVSSGTDQPAAPVTTDSFSMEID